MEDNNNQLHALILAFAVIGAMYGIIFGFGLLLGIQ